MNTYKILASFLLALFGILSVVSGGETETRVKRGGGGGGYGGGGGGHGHGPGRGGGAAGPVYICGYVGGKEGSSYGGYGK